MKTNFILIITALLTSFTIFSQEKWSLKKCITHALENNISVKQNNLNIELSKTDIKNAKGNFLPTIGASTGGNLNFGSTSNNRVSQSTYGGAINLNSNVTIFNGYRNLNLVKQAELGVKSSELDVELIKNDISLQVINAYLNSLFAKENLNVAKKQYEISKKQINRAKEQFESGVVAKVDLLNTEAAAENNNQLVTTNENNLRLALFNLAQLLQVSPDGFDVEAIQIESLPLFLYKDSNAIYTKAIENRPEIKKGQLSIEQATLSTKIAKASYYPTITGSGSIGTNYGFSLNLPNGAKNTNLGTQLDTNLGYGVGFNVNIPIFNGFKNDANVARTKIQKDVAEIRLESQKLKLQQDIERFYLDAKLASKSYEAAKKSLAAQQEAFNNATTSLEYGTMTIFDFNQVLVRFVNAQATLIRAKYDYVFKTKVLLFYAGENIVD